MPLPEFRDIDELYVAPAQTRLADTRKAGQKAREMGVNAVHLEVDLDDDAARSLYLGAGYKDRRRFLMTKWLNRAIQVSLEVCS